MMSEYKEILKKAEEADARIANTLKWLLKRCALETGPKLDEAEGSTKLSDDNGLEMMNEFLHSAAVRDKYFSGGVLDSESLRGIEPNEFQEKFFSFLSQRGEMETDPWIQYPKEFINKLAVYRNCGGTDENQSKRLMDFSKKINNDPLRYVYEIIQNADDCEYKKAEERNIARSMKLEFDAGEIWVSYPEDGMTYSDIIAITTIGESNKLKKKRRRIIGEKGMGFKTIFSVCDFVEIHSGPYHFKLTQDNFEPKWIEEKNGTAQDGDWSGTELRLHFNQNIENHDVENQKKADGKNKVCEQLLKKYGGTKDSVSVQNIFKNCPIMFTNKIDELCISCGEEKLVMKRRVKEDNDTKIEEISYRFNKDDGEPDLSLKCIRIEKLVKFDYEKYKSHYKEVFESEADYNNEEDEVKTYPVIVLIPVEVRQDGKPLSVSEIEKGNVFTYLPTFSNIKAPISIQIPFELNEDRSCMWIQEMKGDDHNIEDLCLEKGKSNSTTKWNQLLFDEVFGADQSSKGSKTKCLLELVFEKLRDREDVYSYIPWYQKDDYKFFSTEDLSYDKDVDRLNKFCGDDEENQIFKTFQNMELLRRMDGKGWLRFLDKPIMFDSLASEIMESAVDTNKNKEGLEELLKIVDQEAESKRKKKEEEKLDYKIEKVVRRVTCDKKGEILKRMNILGMSQIDFNELSFSKKDFVNKLMELDYEKVVGHLLEESGNESISCLPAKEEEERKGLKVINVKTADHAQTRWAVDDAELWIVMNGEYKTNQWLAFYDENKNKVNGKSVLEIFGDLSKLPICLPKGNAGGNRIEDVWKCVWEKIRPRKETEKGTVDCSFELFKELMRFMSRLSGCDDCRQDGLKEQIESMSVISDCNDKPQDRDGWFEFAKKIMEDDQSNDILYGFMREDLIALYNKIDKNFRGNWPCRWQEVMKDDLKNDLKNKLENDLKNDLEKAEILGILSYGKSEDKKPHYLLQMGFLKEGVCWPEGICNIINKMPFDKNYRLAKNDEKKLNEIQDESITKIFEPLRELLGIQTKIYTISSLRLPTEYVRFNGIVILRKESESEQDKESCLESSAKKCLSSIEEGLELYSDIEPKKKELFLKKDACKSYEHAKKDLQTLTDLCALSAKFHMDRQPAHGSENETWYELLQNANDHIPDNAADQTLYITADSDNLVLEYADQGFSIRDFLAVSTSGNSGNTDVDIEREGRKGTGFKSVYDWFDKAVIYSSDIVCTLEDQPVKVKILKSGEISFGPKEGDQEKEKWEKEKTHYPIPRFVQSDRRLEGTKIELHWRKDKIENFKARTGICKKDEFISKKVYLFLDRIKKFHFKVYGEEFTFDKQKYISEHFVACTKEMSLSDDIINKNRYWSERRKRGQSEEILKEEISKNEISEDTVSKDTVSKDVVSEDVVFKKKNITILFPVTDAEKIGSDKEVSVFCTLPVEEFKLKIPFYVNIPLLELRDNRKGLADQGELKEWNQNIIEAALTGTDSAFSEIFSEMSRKKDGKINLNNLYQYFPYSYLYENPYIQNTYKMTWRGCLMSVPFIRAVRTTGKMVDDKAYCLEDWANESDVDQPDCDKFVFLPKYMYWWFAKRGSLDGFECEIPFVYYDDLNVDDLSMAETDDVKMSGSIETLKCRIQRGYPYEPPESRHNSWAWRGECGREKNMLLLKRTQQGKAGRILLDVESYVRTKADHITGQDQELFFQWLRVMKGLYFKSLKTAHMEGDDLRFQDFFYQKIMRVFFSCYLRLKKQENKDERKKYHCIGNRELSMGDHPIELEDYINLCRYADHFREEILQEEKLEEKEKYAIKSCVENLLESPYLKYQREEKDDLWEEKCELWDNEAVRNHVDFIKKAVKEQIREGKDQSAEELLYEYTKDLFQWASKKTDADEQEQIKEKIKSWMKAGNENLLYGRTHGNKFTALDENTYFTIKRIENEHIVDFDKILVCGYLKDLNSEIRKPEFYKNSKRDFVKVVIARENYSLYEWWEGAEKFLYGEKYSGLNEEGKEVYDLLLKEMMNRILKKESSVLKWNEEFKDSMKHSMKHSIKNIGKNLDRGFSQKDFCNRDKSCRAVFKFCEGDKIRKISEALKDGFRGKVSDGLSGRLLKGDLQEEITLGEFVEQRVYFTDCQTGNKSLYCWADFHTDSDKKKIVVLFGENSFGRMLREEFDCNEYFENKVCTDMDCVPVDSLTGWVSTALDENERDAVYEHVKKLAEKLEVEWDGEWLKNQLVNRFDMPYLYEGSRKWISASGYGGKEFHDKKCPICGSILIAEGSLVRIGYIKYQRKSRYLPMLMCENCYKSFRYAQQVSLGLEEDEELESFLDLTHTDKKEIPIVFHMYAKETKEMKVEVTFLNRWIWYVLINKD